MKLNNKILIPCVLVLFCVLCVFVFCRDTKNNVAVIKKDGKVLHTIDLSEVKEPYTVDLSTNIVLVEQSGIRMLSADCPDKLCVKQGSLNRAPGAIICLPNGVTIEFSNGKSDVDAVAGAR